MTKKTLTDAAIKKSETDIRKAFNAVDTASFTADIAIHDGQPSATLMSNVTVEFLIGNAGTPSKIKFTCNGNANTAVYTNAGLSQQYSTKDAKMKYAEFKDFQSTYRELTVKPTSTKTYITIDLRK